MSRDDATKIVLTTKTLTSGDCVTYNGRSYYIRRSIFFHDYDLLLMSDGQLYVDLPLGAAHWSDLPNNHHIITTLVLVGECLNSS